MNSTVDILIYSLKGSGMDEPSLWGRLKTSLQASAGEVVFGMEDGTVSIFGLVFGVAATTTDQKAVLIAGASGAVAAAVSMMAGTYLDVETSQDQAKVMASRIAFRFAKKSRRGAGRRDAAAASCRLGAG